MVTVIEEAPVFRTILLTEEVDWMTKLLPVPFRPIEETLTIGFELALMVVLAMWVPRLSAPPPVIVTVIVAPSTEVVWPAPAKMMVDTLTPPFVHTPVELAMVFSLDVIVAVEVSRLLILVVSVAVDVSRLFKRVVMVAVEESRLPKRVVSVAVELSKLFRRVVSVAVEVSKLFNLVLAVERSTLIIQVEALFINSTFPEACAEETLKYPAGNFTFRELPPPLDGVAGANLVPL